MVIIIQVAEDEQQLKANLKLDLSVRKVFQGNLYQSEGPGLLSCRGMDMTSADLQKQQAVILFSQFDINFLAKIIL